MVDLHQLTAEGKLTPADRREIYRIATYFYQTVWNTLDSEPNLDGEIIGKIAHNCEEILKESLAKYFECNP